jgi:methanogenic corrinoid protein MtbC1
LVSDFRKSLIFRDFRADFVFAGWCARIIQLGRVLMGAIMSTFLSPKALAQAIGSSESSLKRWADEGRIHVARTAGGHRRIALTEALRFVRESGLSLVQPEAVGLGELSGIRDDLAAAADPLARSNVLLFEALEKGDELRARGVVLDLYLAGRGVASICDGPMREAMQRLGELWLHSAAGIYVEHRATVICLHILAMLRTLAVRDGPERAGLPVALGGAPAGDPYALPSLMAAIVLADTGYADVNLGGNTPTAALLAAIEHHRPRLVWLSCSVKEAMPAAAELAELADTLAGHGASLVVGGRGVPDAPRLPRHDHLHRVSSMAELTAFARGLLAAV